MPTELISVGPVTNLLANVVYALPASPCTITAGAVLQKSTSFAGTYSDWIGSNSGVYHQGGGHCKCVGNTTVKAVKIKPAKQGAAIPYVQAVLNDKPSHYWRINESGNPIADIVGGANGTASGGIAPVYPGALSNDGGAHFDGVSAQIVTPAFNLTPPFSIEFWVNPDSVAKAQGIIEHSDGAGGGFQFYQGNGGSCLLWIINDFPPFPTSIVPALTLSHLVLVFTSSISASLYRNGVFVSSVPFAPYPGVTQPFRIGGPQGSNWYPGMIDEVAIYPYALSAQQILKHYQARS